MSCALFAAASLMSLHVFVTAPWRSSHTGSAWVTATWTCELDMMVDLNSHPFVES